MIVVISHPEDPHARRVLEHLASGHHDAVLLNVADLPQRATIAIDYEIPSAPAIEFRNEERCLPLHEASAVWWRRPQVAEPLVGASAAIQVFTANEWQEAVS